MSTHSNTLMQKLVLYGDGGSINVLMDISKAVLGGDKFDTIHIPLALKVSKLIFGILDRGVNADVMSNAICCLMAMCESDKNSEAKSFVQSLEQTTILKHCVQGCRHPRAGRRQMCSFILRVYAFESDKRCCEMLQYAGLLEAVLMVIESFQPDSDPEETMAANHAVRVLQSLLQCTYPLERIVRAGGRQTLDLLLHKVAEVSRATVSEPQDAYATLIDSCADTCRSCYGALLARHTELIEGGLSIAHIVYNTEQTVDIMGSWYDVVVYLWFTEAPDEHVLNNAIAALVFCTSCCASTQLVPDTNTDYLVATDSEFEAMVRNIFTIHGSGLHHLSVDSTFVAFTLNLAVQLDCDTLSNHIFKLVCKYPGLKVVVEEYVGRYRYCAHPDCIVSSFVHGALRKCARCRSHSVWYCGKEHQIAHWPEHKLTCKGHNGSSAVKPV